MRKYTFRKLLLSTLFFFLTAISTLSAQAPPVFQELILQVPSVDESRSLPQLKTDLLALGGIQFINYCNSLKCIMLKIDRNIHPNDQVVHHMFEVKLIPYHIKTGATISQILSKCTDQNSTTTGAK